VNTETPPPSTVEAWKDDAGKLWTAVSGRRQVWAMGDAVKLTLYPTWSIIARNVEMVLMCVVTWQTFEIVSLLRALISLEIER